MAVKKNEQSDPWDVLAQAEVLDSTSDTGPSTPVEDSIPAAVRSLVETAYGRGKSAWTFLPGTSLPAGELREEFVKLVTQYARWRAAGRLQTRFSVSEDGLRFKVWDFRAPVRKPKTDA